MLGHYQNCERWKLIDRERADPALAPNTKGIVPTRLKMRIWTPLRSPAPPPDPAAAAALRRSLVPLLLTQHDALAQTATCPAPQPAQQRAAVLCPVLLPQELLRQSAVRYHFSILLV